MKFFTVLFFLGIIFYVTLITCTAPPKESRACEDPKMALNYWGECVRTVRPEDIR